jgi:hypothetical protein
MIGTTRTVAGWWLASLFAIAAWLVPGTAGADVAAVIVAGTAPQSTKDVVARAVRERIVERQWLIHDVTIPSDKLSKAIECLGTDGSPSCASALVPKGIDRLVVLSVRVDDGSGVEATYVAAWVLSGTGELLVGDGKVCEGCRAPAIAEQMGELVVAMWREILARSGQTVLQIETTPASAKASIEVDGERIGFTEIDYGVYPGMRRVEVRAPGYCPESRIVNARPQEVVPIQVALKACRSKRNIWPWVVIGAGGAAILGGGALVLADEDPTSSGDQIYSGRNTAPWGWSLAAVGGLAVGAGIVWLVRSPEDESSRRPVTGPTASWDRGAVWLGYQGQF